MGLLFFRIAKTEPDTGFCWESQGIWIADAGNCIVRTVASVFINERLIQNQFHLHEQAWELQLSTSLLSLDNWEHGMQMQGWELMGEG